MTKFFDQLDKNDKEKYSKDINKSINFEKYPKIRDFILNNDLYITNVKTGPIEIQDKESLVILDNSQNKWFVLCIDGKINLLAKKNIIIHTDMFKYDKRTVDFTKVQKIKKVDYLVEYIQDIGANLSLNIKNYKGKIGKQKWDSDYDEIRQMTLELPQKNTLAGYTYNDNNFSLCIIGKGYDKQKDILC